MYAVRPLELAKNLHIGRAGGRTSFDNRHRQLQVIKKIFLDFGKIARGAGVTRVRRKFAYEVLQGK